MAEVTLQELQSHYREELEGAIEKTNSVNSTLRKLRAEQTEYTVADIDQEITEYDIKLRDELSNREVSVIPLSSLSHSEILDHMKRGKRPVTGDAGYKDLLLYQAFVSTIEDGVPALFITNDNDFYLGQKPHPDILDQIVQMGKSTDDVHFFRDLKSASDWLENELGITDAPKRPLPSLVEITDSVDFDGVIAENIHKLTESALRDIGHDLVFYSADDHQYESLKITRISPVSADYWYCEVVFEININVSGLDSRYLQYADQEVPALLEVSATVEAALYVSVDDWAASGFGIINIDSNIEESPF